MACLGGWGQLRKGEGPMAHSPGALEARAVSRASASSFLPPPPTISTFRVLTALQAPTRGSTGFMSL